MSKQVTKRQIALMREILSEELVHRMSLKAQLRSEAKTIEGQDIDSTLRRAAAHIKAAECDIAIKDMKTVLRTLETSAERAAAKRRERAAIRRHAKKAEGRQMPLFELN